MKLEYGLEQELSSEAKEFVQAAIERSFSVNEVAFSSDRVSVDFEVEIAESRFREAVKNLLYVSKSINRTVLFENPVGHPYGKNPMTCLLESGDVIKTGEGMFSFQGDFWRVFKACQNYVTRVADGHEAVEQEYPVLWPIDLYRRINYLAEFPHQVILAAPVQSDFEARANFATEYDKRNSYEAVSMQDGIDAATYGLQCAVCDICYYNMRNSRNQKNSLFTTYNKVFRNETSPTGDLDRLTNFSVRDIMFVGEKDYVLVYRQKMLEEAEELLRRLNLDSKIETANDPFFSNDAVIKNVFQSASELKHELLVKLKYADKYLAVGSVNLHLDFFGQAFDIQLPDGSPVYSGCLGIGFERLVFAIYCQYGPSVNEWPASVRETLEL